MADISPNLRTVLSLQDDVISRRLQNSYDITDVGSFLDYDGTNFSYMPRERCLLYVNNYTARGRVSGRPIRIVKTLLPDDVHLLAASEATWEQWANQLAANYRVFTGDWEPDFTTDVHDVYNNGPSSCMTGEDEDFYRIYTDNGVRMIVAQSNNRYIARALVWDTAEYDGKPTVYLDRAYGNEMFCKAFVAYAQRNGWAHYDDYGYFTVNGERGDTRKLRVKVARVDQSTMPSLDTFSYHWEGYLYPHNAPPVSYADQLSSQGLCIVAFSCAMCEATKDKSASYDFFGSCICLQCAEKATIFCAGGCGERVYPDYGSYSIQPDDTDRGLCLYCKACHQTELDRKTTRLYANYLSEVYRNQDWYYFRRYHATRPQAFALWREENPEHYAAAVEAGRIAA